VTTTLLHPVLLAAIEPPAKRLPPPGQVAGLLALMLGIVVLSLAIG